jgi:hypothetical protein
MPKSPLWKNNLVLAVFFLFSFNAFSQQKVDSLRVELENSIGVEKIDIQIALGKKLIYSEPKESEEHIQAAIQSAKNLDYRKGLAKAYLVQSTLLIGKSEIFEAKKY